MIQQAEELYPLFIGEMGIAPAVFFSMTPAELNLATKGFIKRRENAVNDLLTALRLNLKPEVEMFSVSNELGYSYSTLDKRKETFSDLGIN